MKSVVGLSSSLADSPGHLVERLESKILREGEAEREEILWLEQGDVDDARRTPRQIRPQGIILNPLFDTKRSIFYYY
jgi:hypothetical protein